MNEQMIHEGEVEFEVWERAKNAEATQAEPASRRDFHERVSRLELIGSLLARPYMAGVDRAVRGGLSALR